MPDVIDRLEDLARHLAVPERDLTDAIVTEIRAGEGRAAQATGRATPNRALVLAAAAVLVIAAVLAVPTSRRAVARWFGIGAVRFNEVPELPANVGTTFKLGREVTLAEAAAAAGRPLLAPPSLGPPDKAFAGAPGPDGVSLVWAPRDGLPEVGTTEVGLLLSQFGGTVNQSLVEKNLVAGTTVEPARVDGHPAFWITGAPHTFAYVDGTGDVQIDSTRLVTGNTLIWEAGGVTHRLETALAFADAVALAESLEPVGE